METIEHELDTKLVVTCVCQFNGVPLQRVGATCKALFRNEPLTKEQLVELRYCLTNASNGTTGDLQGRIMDQLIIVDLMVRESN